MEHARFWIIGAGRFGTLAARRLKKKYPAADITGVDCDPGPLKRLAPLEITLVCAEGAAYLEEKVTSDRSGDWIVPAVPIHLAFQWCLRRTAGRGFEARPVPAEVEKMLPNPVRGPRGEIYTTYADFLCPDNCREPYDRCTFTGKPRIGLLYKKIEDLRLDGISSVVIRSRQLAPGVGGYQGKDLEEALRKVFESRTPTVLWATACLCHGVVDALRPAEPPTSS